MNMADTGNFSASFFVFTTEAGLYIKGKLLRVVHGWNKVMLGSMELHKELFRW